MPVPEKFANSKKPGYVLSQNPIAVHARASRAAMRLAKAQRSLAEKFGELSPPKPPDPGKKNVDADPGQSTPSGVHRESTRPRAAADDDATALLWRLARSGPPAQKIAALRELRRVGSESEDDAPNPLAGMPTEELIDRLIRLGLGLFGIAGMQRKLAEAARDHVALAEVGEAFRESRQTGIMRQRESVVPPTGEVQVVASRLPDDLPPAAWADLDAGAQPAERTDAEADDEGGADEDLDGD